MSQALEDYKNHQFHKTWQSFKDEFNKGYIPEQIDDPARLESYNLINKKIKFIDNWLMIIDPELGTTNTHLTTAHNLVNTAKNHITNEQVYVSRNDTRNAISNLNNCILKVSECVDTIRKLPIAIQEELTIDKDKNSKSITEMLQIFQVTIDKRLKETNNKIQELNNTKQEYEKKFDFLKQEYEKEFEKYKKTREEVESHRKILSATGLAGAYSKERKNLKNIIILCTCGFLFIIMGIIFIGGNSVIKNSTDLHSIDNILHSLLRTVPFILPLIWLALYVNKRRSEYHRLEQEYAHKAILAKLYLSYKEQIEELQTDDPELLKKLMSSTIDSIAYNPSPTLDKKHGDGTVLNEVLNSTKEIPNTLKELLEIVKTLKK